MAVGENNQTHTDAYGKAFSITASDSADFTVQTRAVMCTVAGNIVAVWEDGTTSTLPIQANLLYPFKLRRINSTSTTATGLFGFY